MYVVDVTAHWSNCDQRRVCLSAKLELPFVPFIGMDLDLLLEDDNPMPTIKDVGWNHKTKEFMVYATVELEWESGKFDLFGSLISEVQLTAVECGWEARVYDDSQMPPLQLAPAIRAEKKQ